MKYLHTIIAILILTACINQQITPTQTPTPTYLPTYSPAPTRTSNPPSKAPHSQTTPIISSCSPLLHEHSTNTSKAVW